MRTVAPRVIVPEKYGTTIKLDDLPWPPHLAQRKQLAIQTGAGEYLAARQLTALETHRLTSIGKIHIMCNDVVAAFHAVGR